MSPRRRQRDYRAEYRRRLALEADRARRLGIPYSRTRARGHPGRGDLSATEIRVGRLRASTLEHYAEINAQLRRLGFGSAAVDLANRYGYAIQVSKEGRPYTIGRVPPEIIDRMTHASRQIFFGY